MILSKLIYLKKAFQWNHLAWSYCFYKNKSVKDIMNRKNKNVLEIGATSFSQMGLLLNENNYEKLLITTYDGRFLEDVKKSLVINFKNKNKIELKVLDIFNIEGRYDLIIMKSILGGIYKGQEKFSVDNFLLEITNKNLNPNGALITIDNGDSLIGKIFFSLFGQRNKKWKYFKPDNFKYSNEIYSFGLFSCVCFGLRIKFLGEIIDTINFLLDVCLNFLVPYKYRAIHCNIYKYEGN